MKVPNLNSTDAKKYVSHLHSRYGIPLSVMVNWRFSQYQESVSVMSKESVELEQQGLNVYAMGLQLFAGGKDFFPTANAITLLGEHISQNVVSINREQVEAFFAAKRIPRAAVDASKVLSDGWVAVAYNGKVIGSGRISREQLIPNLPRWQESSGGDEE